jgi:hypothetical protein
MNDERADAICRQLAILTLVISLEGLGIVLLISAILGRMPGGAP